jgi:hypothetical protein
MLDLHRLSVRQLHSFPNETGRMLMVRKNSGYTATDMLGHEQEGLDALIGLHCVFDSLSHVQATVGCFQKNSIKRASDWKWAKKPVSKHRDS